MIMTVRAQFQTSWATFVAMKDGFDQCLYRPQGEVAREVLRARDLLIDLEKVALHPALKEEWRVISDLNVGIVEALKLKQPNLVALFIARRLGEATASEKAGAIRTAHAELKELKAMGGKGGFAELANWVIPPPGHGSLWGATPGPTHNPHHAGGGFGGGGFSNGAGAFNSAYMGGTHGGGGGTPAAAWGTTGLRTGGSTEDTGGEAAEEAAGAAAAEVPRSAASVPSRVRLPRTIPIRCAL